MSARDTLGPPAANDRDWLSALKARVRQVQLKAAVAVNEELLRFYWTLGAEIVERQKNAAWGTGFLQRLSQDLLVDLPEMKGFSLRNIKYIRQWYLFYSGAASNGQQPVAQVEGPPCAEISQIPWGHNLAIISKCEGVDEALYYVGVSEYQLTRSLPESLKSSLPSIEALEAELEKDEDSA